MNMPTVIPPAEKPAETRIASEKTTAVKKKQAGIEEKEVFSELLFMLSSSGNKLAGSYSDSLMSCTSMLNHGTELQTDFAQSGSISQFQYLHSSDDGSPGDGVEAEAEAEPEPEPEEAIISRSGAEVPLFIASDADAYKGSFDMNSLKEGFNKHIQLLHSSDDGSPGDGVEAEAEAEPEPEEAIISRSGAEVPLFVAGDADAYKGSFDMNSFKEGFNKQIEQVPDTTVDVMPEIIPNMVPENPGYNSNEFTLLNIHTNRPDIVSHLSDRLVDLYHIGGNSAKIRLQPEELGNLHIDISVINDSISAIITVEEKSVKGIIDANIDMLVEQLRRSGLNIDQFTVNIASSYNDKNIASGWSDGNSGEMFKENLFSPNQVQEDTLLSHLDEATLYAGTVEGISIFV